jgi:hypothetical protein
MRKNKSVPGANPINTLQKVRNLIDNQIAGIVSEVDNVPLNFYVAVRLFNTESGNNAIGAVGAATDVDSSSNSVPPFGASITPFTTNSNEGRRIDTSQNPQTFPTTVRGTVAPNPAQDLSKNTVFDASQNFGTNLDKNTNISINQQPGVMAARKLFIWIVFKNQADITNPAFPVESPTVITSGVTGAS